MIKSPCKGCTERSITPNCHSYCKSYLEYKQSIADARAKKDDYSVIYEFDKESHDRIDKFMRRYIR